LIDVAPIRASFSMDNIVTNYAYGSPSFGVFVNQELPQSSLCVVDKSGKSTLIMQVTKRGKSLSYLNVGCKFVWWYFGGTSSFKNAVGKI
jgi:hypothetical protein